MKKITQRLLHAVQNHARRYLLDTPLGAKLPGMRRELDEGERLALAFLNASLTVINGDLGVDTSDVTIIFDDSEGSPI